MQAFDLTFSRSLHADLTAAPDALQRQCILESGGMRGLEQLLQAREIPRQEAAVEALVALTVGNADVLDRIVASREALYNPSNTLSRVLSCPHTKPLGFTSHSPESKLLQGIYCLAEPRNTSTARITGG